MILSTEKWDHLNLKTFQKYGFMHPNDLPTNFEPLNKF